MIAPQITYQSSRGRRDNNEDAYGIPKILQKQTPLCARGSTFSPSDDILTEKGYLFILADGVGGVAGGDIASSIVVTDVGKRYYDDPSLDISVSLQRVIQASNRHLRQIREQHQTAQKMATTIIAAVCLDNEVHIASVGDSRAYLITNQSIQRITHDHSWLEEHKHFSPSVTNLNSTMNAHRITRSIGSHHQVGVDTWRLTVKAGDRILLCTDGLSNYIDEANLFSLCRIFDLNIAMNHIIDTAYDRGSTDNISAILIEPRPSRQDPPPVVPLKHQLWRK